MCGAGYAGGIGSARTIYSRHSAGNLGSSQSARPATEGFMATHTATIEWQRGCEAFLDNRYSRAHLWSFDGGARVAASSSPHVVRAPLSDPANVDPEEAFVAALSSCHMLWFLSIAAAAGFCVDSYRDEAIGHMTRNENGKQWLSRVELRPRITFSGSPRPEASQIERLHHQAHAECFLANSVRTEISVHSS